ncbi:MAG: YbaK/EbsC family protein [Arenicellales bacterium]
MPVQKLRAFLDEHQIKYIVINHSPAYTAREAAASTLIPRREFAKSVLVKSADGKMLMAVVPASRHADLDALVEASGGRAACLATEAEFESLFPGCEAGAVPPFGNLYGIPVYADRELAREDDLAFTAGLHTQIIRMSAGDYFNLVKPVMGDFAKRE